MITGNIIIKGAFVPVYRNDPIVFMAFREDKDGKGFVTRHEWMSTIHTATDNCLYVFHRYVFHRIYSPGCGPSPWVTATHVDQDATFIRSPEILGVTIR